MHFKTLLRTTIDLLIQVNAQDMQEHKKLYAPLLATYSVLTENKTSMPQFMHSKLAAMENKTSKPAASVCKFADIQNELHHKQRPCKGRVVICQHPNAPKDENEELWKWYESGCNPQKCKLYEAVKC